MEKKVIEIEVKKYNSAAEFAKEWFRCEFKYEHGTQLYSTSSFLENYNEVKNLRDELIIIINKIDSVLMENKNDN